MKSEAELDAAIDVDRSRASPNQRSEIAGPGPVDARESEKYEATMWRRITIAIVAGFLGVLAGAVTLHAATLLKTWRQFGPDFQLGYVVGYLEGMTLARRKDPRAAVPTRSRMDFDVWVQGVNEYFKDPANAKRSVPDAMAFVGQKFRERWLDEWSETLKTRSSPQPSPSS
jgi:hypothetical protein